MGDMCTNMTHLSLVEELMLASERSMASLIL